MHRSSLAEPFSRTLDACSSQVALRTAEDSRDSNTDDTSIVNSPLIQPESSLGKIPRGSVDLAPMVIAAALNLASRAQDGNRIMRSANSEGGKRASVTMKQGVFWRFAEAHLATAHCSS